uniref:Fibronectin type-III domain-containing protein n=1 Tax=Oncorhynchus tshawytscha TaxID=74940 RepID=A0AAZ3REX9_ONCTS
MWKLFQSLDILLIGENTIRMTRSACLTLCVPVLAELPQPQNLTLLTLNTQYVLTWDWDQTTTVYFGLICSSPCLASLGPPSRVELAPVGNLLDVTISDPLTSTQHSMKEHVLFLYYRILYWSRSDDPQVLAQPSALFLLDSSNNLVTLPELEAWTWYCVMIQSRYDYYNKTSSYTEPQCMQTEGDTPYGQIFLYFLVSMMVCFLLVLLPSYTLFRFYRVLKNTFYPSIQLPVHIQEYLCDSSPGSDMPRLLTADSEAELCCDKLTICPEVVLLEIHPKYISIRSISYELHFVTYMKWTCTYEYKPYET